MTTVVGKQGRYVEIVHPQNCTGKIKVEAARWTVDGFKWTHEFRFILVAETCETFIRHGAVVEHRINGNWMSTFEWGHGPVEAYRWSQTWRNDGPGKYAVELIAAHIFRKDLPCCHKGGEFVRTAAASDLCTIERGHCSVCHAGWEITDGRHFDML